jgi:hypothetical protein
LQKAISSILAAQSVAAQSVTSQSVEAHSSGSSDHRNGWRDPVAAVTDNSTTIASANTSVVVKGDVKLQLLVVFLNSALRLRAVHMLLLGEGLHAGAADSLHDLAQVTRHYSTLYYTI